MSITSTSAGLDLLGREHELDELDELLTRARLITLTGPAGVGKSRLAEVLGAGDRWTAQVTADLLDAPDPAGAQDMVRHAAATLAAADGDRLLILDNCDLLLGFVARSAPVLLAEHPELRIVATTRESLGTSGETVYPVRPLSPPDAAALFAYRAGARRGGVIPGISPEIIEICTRLDGLPLAVELAAAATSALTPTQIAGRLDDALRLLGGGTRTGDDRHQSLRAALDWGAQTLSQAERVLLRRLSVFAGAFTLESAEQVGSGSGLGEDEVLMALAGLVAKSLLDCDPSGEQARYRLMHTVRQYASHELTKSGETELMQRNRVSFAIEHPANVCTPDPAALCAADLAEALRWCAALGVVEDGLRLATTTAPFWLLSGRFREGAELVGAQLAAADADGRHDAPYTRALLARGMFDCVLGQGETARSTALQAAAWSVQNGDSTGELWAEALAGAAVLQTDPQEAARRLARAAAGLAPGSPWTPVAGALYAVAAAEAGQMAEAEDAAAGALAAARAGPLIPAVIAGLLAVGRVARKQGRHAAAQAALAEADALAAGPEAGGARAAILAECGRLAVDRGSDDDEPDRGLLDQAVTIAAGTDSPLLLAAALDVAGRSRLRQARGPAGRAAFAQVTALSRETGAAQAVAGILGLGQVALAAGSASAAWTLIEEAHVIARTSAGPGLLARTLQAVGDCARALGDASRAWAAYHRALGLRVGAGFRGPAAESLESLAGLALEQDRAEYGVRLLGAAAGLHEEMGSARPASVKRDVDAATAAARALFAPERFAELYSEGMRLSLAEAAVYAGRQRGPRQRGEGWVSLTPTERQVADLAATGLTNREIGQRLFSSPRTVQVHLSHIFAKLGISSRKMLAVEMQARNRLLPLRAPQAET